ncbi:hypothetical protein Sjap_002026 [Stephania japonica]|uniref:Uncharacterized protein n=1 Tax=Stephania japonica TaxID=461633 RepID=A0AAP0KL94_9MAGN
MSKPIGMLHIIHGVDFIVPVLCVTVDGHTLVFTSTSIAYILVVAKSLAHICFF